MGHQGHPGGTGLQRDNAHDQVRAGSGDRQRDVETIVNAIFDEITEALCDSNRVELRGFGAFSVKNRPPRSGRNPRTGEAVSVDEKWVPFFKAGKELRERLNRK